jgi:hypothetical protein
VTLFQQSLDKRWICFSSLSIFFLNNSSSVSI